MCSSHLAGQVQTKWLDVENTGIRLLAVRHRGLIKLSQANCNLLIGLCESTQSQPLQSPPVQHSAWVGSTRKQQHRGCWLPGDVAAVNASAIIVIAIILAVECCHCIGDTVVVVILLYCWHCCCKALEQGIQAATYNLGLALPADYKCILHVCHSSQQYTGAGGALSSVAQLGQRCTPIRLANDHHMIQLIEG